MIKQIGLGNDITIRWKLEHFIDNYRLFMFDSRNNRIEIDYDVIDGNIITWVFRGKDQKYFGTYSFVLYKNYNKENQEVIGRKYAFTLVCNEEVEYDTEVELDGEFSVGVVGSITNEVDELKDIVQDKLEQIDSFVSEWAKGKEKIIESLKKWGMEADRSDSFDDLSQKILDLPVKGENEDGFLPPSYNNVNLDLLNILNNHRRMDYPYCWGAQLMAENHITYQLRNADAYLTSDGHFYEEDTDHVFELDDSVYYWVIFYYKDPTYTVTNPFYNQLYTCCLNGKPSFNFDNNSIRAGIIESYTDEKYVLQDASTINNAYLVKVNLSGIEEIYSDGYVYLLESCTNVEELHMPDLKVLQKYIARSCTSLRCVVLPNLREILSYGVTNACSNIVFMSLPNLEVIRAGYINYLQSSSTSLKKLHLPKLREIYDARILYYHAGMTNITLPALELVEATSSNGLFYQSTGLTEINMPSLRTWNGTKPLFEGSNSTDPITINMPSLFTTSNQQLNLIYRTSATEAGGDITINLGKPDGGYIYFNTYSTSTNYDNFKARLKTINVEKGFRSYLRVSTFTSLTKECLEAIIDNLADNTEYDTLQIVFGATNLAKVSDEYKLMATNKNYTLS